MKQLRGTGIPIARGLFTRREADFLRDHFMRLCAVGGQAPHQDQHYLRADPGTCGIAVDPRTTD